MSEFDEFAENYNDLLSENKYIKASGYPVSYFDEYKVKEVARVLKYKVNNNLKILDFGCGVGKSMPFFCKYFSNSFYWGVDVSVDSIAKAKETNVVCNKFRFDLLVDFICINKEKFDVLFVANIFHHIKEEEHEQTFMLLKSLLAESGSIFIFEHNPLNPISRKLFASCVFDANCKMLWPSYLTKIIRKTNEGCLKKRYIVFFSWTFRFLNYLEPKLSFLPFGAQYYLQFIDNTDADIVK